MISTTLSPLCLRATLLRLAGRANAAACSQFVGLLRVGGSWRDQVEREGKLLAWS
jgi:hypothetical protein